MCCHQNKPGTRWCSYSANANETHLSSDSGNPSCCRLCGLVKDVTYCKKSPQEGEWRIAHCGGGCVWKIFDLWSLPRKEATTVKVLWTAIYGIQGLDYWKPKSLQEERKGEKIYARVFEVSPRCQRPKLCRVWRAKEWLFAVCISPSFLINWIFLRPKGS